MFGSSSPSALNTWKDLGIILNMDLGPSTMGTDETVDTWG